MAPIDYKSLMKDALLRLEELEARLKAAESGSSDPIAILGMGCRFPGGANTPDEFWKLLSEGKCASTEIPANRWSVDRLFDADPDERGKMYSRHGCFLEDIDKFDAQFFGISPREAAQMDPQQRLLLEVAWEALERAGIAPTSLAGTQTGVMVGVMNNDYVQFAVRSPADIDVHTGGGTTVSATAGRLSYFLGLQGPCMAIDTACSSSLVSVHLACRSLRNRECDLAIAAGVNAILSPVNSIIESRTRILSVRGVCRTFDASADGIVRGEGCGVVVLKRLSDAMAAGDPVLAVIRGSAVNHDGHTSALSVPNGLAQQNVIRRALADAGAAPGKVAYVEAHGTATPLGDPIEVEALGEVFGPGRSSDAPLYLGSVKTNLGHLEGAAGIAGLIKVVLAIEHEEIPPHLHFTHPNPLIAWDSLSIRVAERSIPWPRSESPRLAGVSSFGFSGTNVHLVLEEPPKLSQSLEEIVSPAAPEVPGGADERCCLLALSAASEAALKELVGQYVEFARTHDEDDLADLCFTANTGRTHFAAARCAVAAASMEELAEKLAHVEVVVHPEQGLPEINFCNLDPTMSGRRRMLSSLGEMYSCGAEIAWDQVNGHSRRRKIALPTYPFQRRRYWFEATDSAIVSTCADSRGMNLVGVRQHSALQTNGEIVYSTVLDANSPAFLGDHRVFGVPVLPASAMVEMILSVASTLLPNQHLSIEGLNIAQALTLPGKQSIAIEHILVPAGGDRYEYRLHSFDEGKGAWTLHASATVRSATGGVLSWPLERAQTECDSELDVEEHFHRCSELGIEYGPAFRAIRRLWCSPGAALCRAVLPESIQPDAGIYRIHPALLDACLQVFLAASQDAPNDLAYLPIGIERVSVYRKEVAELWSYCKVREGGADTQTYRADLWIADANGAIVAQVEGLTVRGTPRHVLLKALQPDGLDDLGYAVEWRASQSSIERRQGAPPFRYLIFAGQDEFGFALAQQMRASGTRCVVASPGESYRRISDDLYQIDPADFGNFDRLFSELEGDGAARLGIINLWPLDVTDRAGLKPGLGSVIHLAQAIARRAWLATPKLWVVTRGARRVADGDIPSAFQGPTWGLLQTLLMEHPEMECAGIDLDSARGSGDLAALLPELSDSPERHVAYRRGERYVARLVRYYPAPAPLSAALIRPDASYLITGGMGGLGLVVARWLADKGARHIIVVGRRAPSDEAAQQIEEIERRGATVISVQADVADAESMAHAIARVTPALAGVFHCAGVLDDGVLLNQTWESFERVIVPKIDGAWNLHELTRDLALDFFVCFSSVASMTGSPGQGNYAASNAFLDALAEHRRALGLPGLSINWGSWMDGGMTQRARQFPANHSPLPSLQGLSSERALSALDELLRQNVAVSGAFAMDWPRFFAHFPQCARLGFFAEIVASGAQARGGFLEELRGHRRERWSQLIEQHVTAQVARVLQLNPSEVQPSVRLFDLGLDSLTAMELKNNLSASLGCTLRSTLAFDYPTVASLALYLNREVSGETSEAQDSSSVQLEMLNEVKRLTDDEIERLVEQELNALAEGGKR
ncbi:MAG TPA: SDR family NAD(P)-dependent oxidoreductase [Terracidiphilus sp.]|nr:SDR family NAD(P)-dependent oxidoreductase [Terracidiphilus sp.]